MTVAHAPGGKITKVAHEEDADPARDGLIKVRSGVTSIEEVARVSR